MFYQKNFSLSTKSKQSTYDLEIKFLQNSFKTSGAGVAQMWLAAFENKAIKIVAQCSAFMKSEFAGRDSKIFDYPNVVIGRANRGLLDSKKHDFKKYPLDKAKAKN